MRLARGTIWSSLSIFSAQAFSAVVSIITARLLGKSGFGELGMLNSTVGMVGVFAGLGLGLTATKYVAEYTAKAPERAGRIIGLSYQMCLFTATILSTGLAVFAPYLARYVFCAPGLVNELRLCGLLVFVNAFGGVQNGILSGFEDFRSIARISLIKGLITLPITITLVVCWNLIGAVLSMIAVSFAGYCLTRAAITKECRRRTIVISHTDTWSEAPIIWKFALPALIASSVSTPLLWVANVLVVKSPGSYGELGLLSAANQWKNFLTYLPFAITSVAIPTLSSVLSEEGGFRNRSIRGLEVTNALTQMVLWPVAVGLMFSAGIIMTMYGKGFDEGSRIFVFLIGGSALGLVGNALSSFIASSGRMWFGAVQNSSWALIILFTTYIGANKHGAFSVALGTAIGYFVLLNWTAVYLALHRELSASLAFRILGGGVVMTALMLLAMVVPHGIAIIIGIPLALLTIPASLYLLVDKQLRIDLFRRMKNLPVLSSWRF
ncbi:MAG: oligosaccharide flippase family protein [Chitinispirillaceae bacterium]|jgi:O-antigen/teichoic acid export membrane protein